MRKISKFLIVSIFLAGGFALNANAATGTLNNAAYTVCYTPGGHCTDAVVNVINNAKSTINVQAYSFTSAPIVKALIKAQKRGVKILVLLDKSNVSSKYSVVNALQNNNIPFLIDYKPAIAHNKVMIIDGAIVITGSFNFTKSAQVRNAENLLIIYSKPLAGNYQQNFDKRESSSESVSKYCMSSTKCKLLSTASDMGNSIKKESQEGWNSTKDTWNKLTN